MSAADHKTLLQNFQRDIDTGHDAILDTYLSADYNDHNPPPFATKTPGRAGSKEAFNIGLGMFSEFKHVVDDQIAEGDKVVTRITGSGRHVGQFLNIPPTNKMVTMSGIAIHRVADGRLVEHWGQVDAIGLLVQMGAMPAPPAVPPLPAPNVAAKPGDVVMAADTMKDVLRRMFDTLINQRNYQAMDDLLHPDFVNHSLPMSVPGPKGFSEALGMFHSAFPDMHVVIEDIVAENDKAASRGYMTGTHQGSFMNVPATGRTIKTAYIDIWKARNGRFIENWVQLDMLGMLVQLGVVPPPA